MFDITLKLLSRDPQDRPSAAELQNHPYLTLPPGWRFEFADMQRPRRSIVSDKSRLMKPPRHLKPSSYDSGQHIPPVPQLPAMDSTMSVPEIRHSVISGKQLKLHQPHLDLERGPRLVFITPPSSPIQDVSRADHTNEPSNLSGTPGFQRLKGFRVVNADPEPDPNKVAFIYQPPPLPSVDNAPYSTRLAPSALYHAPYSPPIIQHSTHSPTVLPSSNYSSTPSPDHPEPGLSHKEGDDYCDSDDSELGTSLWKRPPIDLTAGRPNDGRTLSSRFSQVKKAIHRNSTYYHEHDAAWAPRPVPKEVYDHLQEFFPRHDLDKAIIDVGHPDSTPEPKDFDDKRMQAKKSIRMVAEEQINRSQTGMRRRTTLWDSNVEELLT